MLPFSPPRIDDKIINEVVDTLKSGWWTTGPKTKRFEKEISAYCGNEHTLCVSSATAGMELMLRWFGVKEGDEVLVPAYTYCATANVVVHCGAKPVMIDVGEDFNMSVDEIKSKITSKTKAIMPVDIAGFPCDYEAIKQIIIDCKHLFKADSENQEALGRIMLMADAAHSFGAKVGDKMAGTLADVSVFSFHAVKNLPTAEGGAIALNFETINNEDIYKYLCIYSLHGQSKDALAKTKVGGWRYDVIEAGFKCNMTDIQASIGLIELERYDSDTLKKRKAIYEMYDGFLQGYDWSILPVTKTESIESSYHVYILRIAGITEEQRDAIMDGIFKREVSVNVHFQPLPMLSVYKNMGYDMADYPGAYNQYKNAITLPVYYNLTDDQVKQVADAVIASVAEVLG